MAAFSQRRRAIGLHPFRPGIATGRQLPFIPDRSESGGTNYIYPSDIATKAIDLKLAVSSYPIPRRPPTHNSCAYYHFVHSSKFPLHEESAVTIFSGLYFILFNIRFSIFDFIHALPNSPPLDIQCVSCDSFTSPSAVDGLYSFFQHSLQISDGRDFNRHHCVCNNSPSFVGLLRSSHTN